MIISKIKNFICDLFDKDTGFFAFLLDGKCFDKKSISDAKKEVPTWSTTVLLELGKNPYGLPEGYSEEILIELIKRLLEDGIIVRSNG